MHPDEIVRGILDRALVPLTLEQILRASGLPHREQVLFALARLADDGRAAVVRDRWRLVPAA